MIINLSYIFCTRNRLPFLKIALERLLTEMLPDEEIVVVDGNSSDGTQGYLQLLFEQGKINQYISERDKNQAHGWNKAMLLAKGVLIKKIIDDDVFCYPAIRECKNYMLEHDDVDVCMSNDLGSSIHNYKHIEKLSRFKQFEEWKEGKTPSFTFGDVHLLIRKSSLAYIGLYNTSFINMDWEYSLRISYLKANIAYYTGYNAMTIAHPNTVTSLRNENLIREQGKKGEVMYDYIGDSKQISWWSHVKIFIGKLIFKSKPSYNSVVDVDIDVNSCYDHFYNYIDGIHKNEKSLFIDSRNK